MAYRTNVRKRRMLYARHALCMMLAASPRHLACQLVHHRRSSSSLFSLASPPACLAASSLVRKLPHDRARQSLCCHPKSTTASHASARPPRRQRTRLSSQHRIARCCRQTPRRAMFRTSHRDLRVQRGIPRGACAFGTPGAPGWRSASQSSRATGPPMASPAARVGRS